MCFSFLIDVFKQWLRLLDCILCQLYFIFSLTYPDSTYTLISDQPMTFHRICCYKADGDVPTFFSCLSKCRIYWSIQEWPCFFLFETMQGTNGWVNWLRSCHKRLYASSTDASESIFQFSAEDEELITFMSAFYMIIWAGISAWQITSVINLNKMASWSPLSIDGGYFFD